MFNYVLKKEKAKTYIRYYIEDDNMINIKYLDGSSVSVENNDSIKRRLNSIEEEQIKKMNLKH